MVQPSFSVIAAAHVFFLISVGVVPRGSGESLPEGTPSGTPETAAPRFESDIKPVLEQRCSHCHNSDDDRQAGLDVQSLSTLFRGGSNGPAIVPGNVEQSILADMIIHGDMPPADEERLSSQEIDLIRRWIAADAAC